MSLPLLLARSVPPSRPLDQELVLAAVWKTDWLSPSNWEWNACRHAVALGGSQTCCSTLLDPLDAINGRERERECVSRFDGSMLSLQARWGGLF